MITKRFKSLVLLSFIISIIVLFNSCLVGGVEKSSSRGSVAFTVDDTLARKIAAAAEEEGLSVRSAYEASYRSLQRSADYSNLFIDVSVKGDFEKTQTIPASEDSSANFSGIPVGSRIYVEAIAYYQEGEDRTSLFEGHSKSFTVREGENQVIFVMHRVSGGEENGENIIPNELPVNLVFIANSMSGGASTNEGTEENPLDSIENAIGKIKAIVADANSGHANDEEWGIVLLSDLTGAQKVTTDADGYMSKLVIASKDSKDIKTIDGGFRSAPTDVGNPAADTTGTTLTITSMTDVVLQCVKITGGWANYGGGIKHYGKNLYIKPGAEIYGNKARYNGAGIFVSRKYDENITVYEPIYLTLDGGLIGGEAGKENICTGREDGNYPGMGGGIYLSGLGEGTGQEKACLTIESGFIKGNKAHYGGGLYEKGMCEVTMNDGTISGNSDNNEGGSGAGVYLDTDGNGIFVLMGGTISSNTAASGGGIYATRTSLGIFGGNISGNTASSGKGAGIYFDKWNESPVFYIKDNPVFGTDDYIYIADSYKRPDFTLTPISLFDSLSGNGQIATIQLEQYNENDVIIKDSCNPAMSAADFAAACKRFKILPQTEDSSGNTLATPVKWGIDSTGKLQTKELNLYVSPSGTGDGSDLTVPFGSIDEAVTYLTNLESSGTNLTAKDITIFIDGTLTSKQTISGTLNADSLTIKGANGVDGSSEPSDIIKSGGLEVTLEGVPVVLKNLEISSCSSSNSALIIGDSSGKSTRLTIDSGVSIKGNYPNNNFTPVHVYDSATLTMKDGSEIKNNFLVSAGGSPAPAANGVLVDSGASFDMQGGAIVDNVYPKGNSYVGLYVCPGASFSMGGNATFINESSDSSNYIVLGAGNKIRITKDLIAGEQCTIYYDDSASSEGDTIFEAASGVNVAAASNLFNFVCESGRALFIDSEGKLTDVNPNTINFFIKQDGTGDGSSEASALGSIADAIVLMNDDTASYVLNIVGEVTGAQVIQGQISAREIVITGTGPGAVLAGEFNVPVTLTVNAEPIDMPPDLYIKPPVVTIKDLYISGAEENGLLVGNRAYNYPNTVILGAGAVVSANGSHDDYENTANGAGVYVAPYSTLIMLKDSMITLNETTGNGGGVYCDDHSSFSFSGGYISYNGADLGDGIYLYGVNSGFVMNGDATVDVNTDNIYLDVQSGRSMIFVAGELTPYNSTFAGKIVVPELADPSSVTDPLIQVIAGTNPESTAAAAGKFMVENDNVSNTEDYPCELNSSGQIVHK